MMTMRFFSILSVKQKPKRKYTKRKKVAQRLRMKPQSHFTNSEQESKETEQTTEAS